MIQCHKNHAWLRLVGPTLYFPCVSVFQASVFALPRPRHDCLCLASISICFAPASVCLPLPLPCLDLHLPCLSLGVTASAPVSPCLVSRFHCLGLTSASTFLPQPLAVPLKDALTRSPIAVSVCRAVDVASRRHAGSAGLWRQVDVSCTQLASAATRQCTTHRSAHTLQLLHCSSPAALSVSVSLCSSSCRRSSAWHNHHALCQLKSCQLQLHSCIKGHVDHVKLLSVPPPSMPLPCLLALCFRPVYLLVRACIRTCMCAYVRECLDGHILWPVCRRLLVVFSFFFIILFLFLVLWSKLSRLVSTFQHA